MTAEQREAFRWLVRPCASGASAEAPVYIDAKYRSGPHVFLGEEEISDVSLAMAARNVSYDGEHKLAERLQLLPLWGLQGLPWHQISRWRPQCQSAQ
jgi:hypothetical protein